MIELSNSKLSIIEEIGGLESNHNCNQSLISKELMMEIEKINTNIVPRLNYFVSSIQNLNSEILNQGFLGSPRVNSKSPKGRTPIKTQCVKSTNDEVSPIRRPVQLSGHIKSKNKMTGIVIAMNKNAN